MPFVSRAPYLWKLRSRSIELGRRTVLMGVLNVTPNSFSDGGRFQSASEAVEAALMMFDEGADIVDVGGESTKPGVMAVSADLEAERVLPVIDGILAHRADALLCIDTYKSATARAAVDAGAEIVNDVSGMLWDAGMGATCASLACGVVLMHTRGRPQEWRSQPRLPQSEVMPLVKLELAERLASAVAAGISAERVVLDPGFGFGKAYENNYPLLAHLDELKSLRRPLMAGVSRKSFLAHTLAQRRGTSASDIPMGERGNPSVAAMTGTILAGAHIVRVHEVKAAVEAAAIADEILNAV
ncbi:MAG TPA: dihydropteroate synthase [Acidisarcina sp.]